MRQWLQLTACDVGCNETYERPPLGRPETFTINCKD